MNGLRHFIYAYSVEYIEAMSGCAAFLWGLWLFNPGYATFASTPSFTVMGALAPEAAWGVAMMVLGVLQLVFLFREPSARRMYVAALMSGVWAFLSSLFVLSNPAATAVPIYSLYALSMFFAAFRLAQHVYGNA